MPGGEEGSGFSPELIVQLQLGHLPAQTSQLGPFIQAQLTCRLRFRRLPFCIDPHLPNSCSPSPRSRATTAIGRFVPVTNRAASCRYAVVNFRRAATAGSHEKRVIPCGRDLRRVRARQRRLMGPLCQHHLHAQKLPSLAIGLPAGVLDVGRTELEGQ